MTEISILEDNAGQVYLVANDKMWGLGPVTLDMKGQANACAEAWATGEWEPNEDDGQVLYDQTLDEALVNLKLIGAWTTQDGLKVVRDSMGEPAAGAGGQDFLGAYDSITIVDGE
jgi:hypothetical protein